MVDVFGILVDVDLDPADAAIEGLPVATEVVGDRCSSVAADIGRLIRGERHRYSRVDPASPTLEPSTYSVAVPPLPSPPPS